jgi:hypothetical protein
MYKSIVFIAIALIFSACSTKTEVNSVICEELQSDPNQVVPKECKVYNETEAEKSYNKVKDKKKTSDNDAIEYTKENKDK